MEGHQDYINLVSDEETSSYASDSSLHHVGDEAGQLPARLLPELPAQLPHSSPLRQAGSPEGARQLRVQRTPPPKAVMPQAPMDTLLNLPSARPSAFLFNPAAPPGQRFKFFDQGVAVVPVPPFKVEELPTGPPLPPQPAGPPVQQPQHSAGRHPACRSDFVDLTGEDTNEGVPTQSPCRQRAAVPAIAQGRTPATSRKQFSQDEDNTLINSINQLLPKYISGELTKKAIYTQVAATLPNQRSHESVAGRHARLVGSGQAKAWPEQAKTRTPTAGGDGKVLPVRRNHDTPLPSHTYLDNPSSSDASLKRSFLERFAPHFKCGGCGKKLVVKSPHASPSNWALACSGYPGCTKTWCMPRQLVTAVQATASP